MYELEATAFRNFGITKFFFPSETLFNRSEPFSFSQPRTKLISSHLNSPSSLVYRIVSIHSIYIRLTHSTHCFIFSLIQRTKTLVNTKTNNSLAHSKSHASLPFSWKTKPTKFLVLVLSVYFRLRNVYCSTSPFTLP